MSSRVGQLWGVRTNAAKDRTIYLVIDEGERDDTYRRWFHKSIDIASGKVIDLQEVDGTPWERLPGCVRFG